ncbi:MAG: hypothetical protein ACRD35_01965 [Candidatus Acidiferrales bacterium]
MATLRTTTAIISLSFLALGGVASAYERQLTPRQIREAYFAGKDNSPRSAELFKDYARTFPVPEKGMHIERIALTTPFKAVADRARTQADYNPVQAEADYKQQGPPLSVEVTVWLTPNFPAHTPYSFPAHTPYSFPVAGPVLFRDPDFWKLLDVQVVQGGKVEPLSRTGQAVYDCPDSGPCWLRGAILTLTYDPDKIASRAVRVRVQPPEGPAVEAEFDLSRLR